MDKHINVGLELRRGKKRFGEKMVLDSMRQHETNRRENICICKVLAGGAIPILPGVREVSIPITESIVCYAGKYISCNPG